jgi:hypothetical protein
MRRNRAGGRWGSQRMQVRHEIIHLIVGQYQIEGGHVAPAQHDRLTHACVRRRASAAGKVLLVQMDHRWALQSLVLVGAVTNGAVRLINLAPTFLAGRQWTAGTGLSGIAAGAQENGSKKSAKNKEKKGKF